MKPRKLNITMKESLLYLLRFIMIIATVAPILLTFLLLLKLLNLINQANFNYFNDCLSLIITFGTKDNYILNLSYEVLIILNIIVLKNKLISNNSNNFYKIISYSYIILGCFTLLFNLLLLLTIYSFDMKL